MNIEDLAIVYTNSVTTKITSIDIDPDIIEKILRDVYGMRGEFSYEDWFCTTVEFKEVIND